VGRARSPAAAVRAYYDQRVAGEVAAWESVVRLDVNDRSRALATGGVEALLALLDPWASWRNPVLGVVSTLDLDLRPNGAGLLLVPSVFARQLWVGGQPESVVVVYPVRRPRPAEHRSTGHRPMSTYALGAGGVSGDPLTALLGRSRAAVLRAALVGANTTDLARRAGISTPSASQHASVLRDAGLLRTTRHGKAAHHTLTPLARALLTGYDAVSRR
jgi:DNA-binding transcriptional ArsR family regulator